MKTKLNPIILAGGVLCLVSMLLSYLSIRILGVVSLPIRWAICARYLNHVLYAVPVVGTLILVSGLVDSKPFQLVATAAGLVVVIWYFIVYRNPLNGDAINYILGANVLISNFVGTDVNLNDIQAVAMILDPFMHIGLGFILFIAGTCLSGVGAFLQVGIGGGRRSSGSSGAPRSYNSY